MDLKQYHLLLRERQQVISENAARRMRSGVKQPPLPVPPKPQCPLVPVAYQKDGTYEGRLASADDCPDGCVVRWEPAAW